MITDADLLILGLLLFVWLVLLALGKAVNAMYAVLSFFVGAFLAIDVYNLLNADDPTVALVLAAMIMAMTFTLPFLLPED